MFLKYLREGLEAQRIYDGLMGKYETRFKVDKNTYAFIAESVAGNCDDDTSWNLIFENIISHRLTEADNEPKVIKAFVEAVDQWVKAKAPFEFQFNGSHFEVFGKLAEGLKKKIKKYNVIDETADQKNESTGEVVPGNILGTIKWTQIVQETVDPEDLLNPKCDEFETKYEEVKEIKTAKANMTFKKDDKLDKGDKSYDQKFESFSDFKNRKLNEEQSEDEIEEAMDVPTKHQMKIALSTFKMNPAMASVAGGMSLKDAYLFMKDKAKWNETKIQSYMRNAGWDHKEIQDLMKAIHIPGMIAKGDNASKYVSDKKENSENESADKYIEEFYDDDEDALAGFDDKIEEVPHEADDEEDCFITDNTRGGYDVSCGGKFISNSKEFEEALEAVKTWQEKERYYPTIWHVSDHGNKIPIDSEGNEIK